MSANEDRLKCVTPSLRVPVFSVPFFELLSSILNSVSEEELSASSIGKTAL